MNFVKNLLYGNKVNDLIKHGMDHYEEENYFGAITYFSQILNIDKKNEKALLERGKSYLKIKSYEKAIADFDLIERINPLYDSEIYKLLSQIFYNLGEIEKSARYAEKYYRMNGDDFQTLYFYARSLYFNKEYDEALKSSDLILAQGYEDFDIRYLRSLILFAQHSFVSSLLEIDKAIEIDALNCFAFNLRGLVNVQLHNFSESIEDFNYAIRLNPTNAIYYFNKAKTQLKIGDLIDAKSSIINCIDIDQENKVYFLLKAQIDLLSENYDEALDSYMKASQLDPRDISIMKIIIRLKLKMGDLEGARSFLKIITDKDDNNPEALFNEAFIDYNLGEKEKAISELTIAIENNPEFKDAILQKGILEYNSENFEEALATITNLLEIDPNNHFAPLIKIRCLYKLNKYNEALSELDLIPVDKKGKDFYLLRSRLNLMLGEIDRSEEDLSIFLNEEKNNIEAQILLNIFRIEQVKLMN